MYNPWLLSKVKYFNMVKEHSKVNEFVLCILLDQNIHNNQLEPEAMYDRPQKAQTPKSVDY